MDWIKKLIENDWLKSPEIIRAFESVKREDFVVDKSLAEVDSPLPIGYGQTISQPLVVAFMLEKLEPKAGEKILDVGSGSGWTTALLSYLVGQKGRVIGLEIVKELKEFGEKNVSKYNFIKKSIAELHLADGRQGYKKLAPYDKILCSAEAKKLPFVLKRQLKIGGRIVIPIENSICVFDKISNQEFLKKCYPGFVFVPLVKGK